MSVLSLNAFFEHYGNFFNPEDIARFINNRVDDINAKITYTADAATHLRTEAVYEHQRAIKPEHVKRLATKMIEGAYKTDVTPVIFGVLNGVVHLIGGNQRLTALVASNEYIPNFSLSMDSKLRRFATAADMREFYKLTHDNLHLTSGESNHINVDLSKVSITKGPELNAVVSAVREIIIDNLDPGLNWMPEDAKGNEVYKAVEQYLSAADQVLTFVKKGVDTKPYLKKIMTAPRFAVLIVLFKYFGTRGKAQQLIRDTYQGNNRPRTPAYHWLTRLEENPSNYGSGGQDGRTKAYREAAAIWNAYVEDPNKQITLSTVKKRASDNKIFLQGVPQDVPVDDTAKNNDIKKTVVDTHLYLKAARERVEAERELRDSKVSKTLDKTFARAK